jgi:hypothetical protein
MDIFFESYILSRCLCSEDGRRVHMLIGARISLAGTCQVDLPPVLLLLIPICS